jgi:hypothetical protein
MFAFADRHAAPLGPGESVERRQLDVACDLLADVLERAHVLNELWHRTIQVDTDIERREAIHEFARAGALFLRDCEDVALRARRARLFGEVADGAGFSTELLDTDEGLAQLGGAYPWAAAAQ